VRWFRSSLHCCRESVISDGFLRGVWLIRDCTTKPAKFRLALVEELPLWRPVPLAYVGSIVAQSKQGNFSIKNDTAVFAAMRFDAAAGKNVWTGLTGTRQAIRRDGYCIDPLSLNFCPHQWIDSQGYVDLEFVSDAPAEADVLPHGDRTL
jgi:hypothetical protein